MIESQSNIFLIGKNVNTGKKSSLHIRRTNEFVSISFNDIILELTDQRLLDQKYFLGQNFLTILPADATHLQKEKRIGHFSYQSSYVSMDVIVQKNIFYTFLPKLETPDNEYFKNLKFKVDIKKYKSKKFENSSSFEITSFEILYNKELL